MDESQLDFIVEGVSFDCELLVGSELIFQKKKKRKFGKKYTLVSGFKKEVNVNEIAKKLKYKIKEMPVHWKNDLESKVKFKSMVKMGMDLVKIRGNIIKGIYN